VLRLYPLARLCRRRLGELFGARAARAYGVGIATSYGLLLMLLPRTSEPSEFSAVLGDALSSASWAVAGLVSLSASRNLAGRDEADGVSALARCRGYDARELTLARFAAAAFVIAAWLFVPFAALSLLAGFRLAAPSVTWTAAWLAFLTLYAPLLALTMSGLSRLAARLYPNHGRSALAAFVLLPHLLHWAFPDVPSLPAAFGWLLQRGTGFASSVA
jgi:ABC-type transport system involved in multi-copper enzyme maturation permease subunit